MNGSGIFMLVVSMITTFGFIYLFYPEHIIGNIIIHSILSVYYIIAMNNPEFLQGGHLLNGILLAIFMLIISNNLRFGELFIGKLRYSMEDDELKVLKDLIDRKIYQENKGQILGNKGFSLIRGVDRIDITGTEDFKGIYGYIKLTNVKNLTESPIEEGKCTSNNFILKKNSRYPECKIDCSNSINCNYITWNNQNNNCSLLSTCTLTNRDKRYSTLSLEKKAKNILSENKYLERGNYIISQNGSHVLVLEASGVLKLYNNPNGSNKTSMVISNIEEINVNLTGKKLILNNNGILSYISNNGSIIWETKNNPGLSTNLILLNRGLLVIYDISTDDVIWTSSNVWRDNNTIEDIRNELISESELKVEYQYNLKTKKLFINKSLVEHRGSILVYNQNGEEERGNIKLYSSKYNGENYMHISQTNSIDGKYLIK